MRNRVSVGLLVALSGCASLLGIEDEASPDNDIEAGASSSGANLPEDRDAATSSSSSGKVPSNDGSVVADADAPDVVCPSAAAECQPETVVTHLRSPGQLAVFGAGKLAFREHVRDDANGHSVLRVYDPASDCHDGACLTTLATEEDEYRLFAGNAHHLCYSLTEPLEIRCHDATSLAVERVFTNTFWRFQAAFADDHRLIYTTPDRSNTAIVHVKVTDDAGIPQLVIPPDGSFFKHVAVQPYPADNPWLAWYATASGGPRIMARRLYDLEEAVHPTSSELVSLTVVGDQAVWATDSNVLTSRYNVGGSGVSIVRGPLTPCPFNQPRSFRSITPGAGSVVAIEGCSIPGAMGTALVDYKLDLSPPTLLATVPASLSSAVVSGRYVYYALSRSANDLGDAPTEEIRRVRYR